MGKNIAIGILSVLVLVLGFYSLNSYIYEEKQGTAMEDALHDMTSGLTGKTGEEFDEAFIDEMIVHHEGAIAMAELALLHAENEELKQLAVAIISAQTKEIEQMKEWRNEWFGDAHGH